VRQSKTDEKKEEEKILQDKEIDIINNLKLTTTKS
jgi:hypothetical protein